MSALDWYFVGVLLVAAVVALWVLVGNWWRQRQRWQMPDLPLSYDPPQLERDSGTVELDPSRPVELDVSGLRHPERDEHGRFKRKPTLAEVLRATRQPMEGKDD